MNRSQKGNKQFNIPTTPKKYGDRNRRNCLQNYKKKKNKKLKSVGKGIKAYY